MNVRSFLLCAFALAAAPSSALACSAVPCSDASLLPASGSVPANMLQLLFTPARNFPAQDAGAVAPRLYRLEGDTKVSVPFTTSPAQGNSIWIAPMQSQAVGTRLVIEDDEPGCTFNGDQPLHAELTVTDAVPLPTTLGTLVKQVKREVIEVSVVNGSCSGLVDAAYADLEVQLSAATAPYASLLRYQLTVDGAEHSPFSTSLAHGERRPRGQARVFAVCTQDTRFNPGGTDLSPGVHRVRIAAELPDGTRVTTEEVEVDLRCTGTPAVWPPDASAPRDAATLSGDADAGLQPSVTAERDDGCTLTSRADGAWLLALALFLARRRRVSAS